MAETAQKTGAPRRGARSGSRVAVAKPAVDKVASDAEVTLDGIELEKVGETKQYSKWAPPKSSGCVGSLYAPLGATAVTVAITGPAD